MNELEQILSSIKSRQVGDRGITLALNYMSAMGPCLDDKTCAGKFFDLGTTAEWEKSLKDAATKLVYRNDAMEFRQRVPGQLTPGSILDFECVLTAASKDRDGDVLESEGAIVDKKMPLLWQHIPMQPIGKFTGLLKQGSKKIHASFAIADTELGRDAAKLVEFGALRISHGFKPLKFEPLEKDKGSDLPAGWHIKQFEIMEGSLVSIPSNPDAVITAFSREKLHHPMVKRWAEMLSKSRPAVVKSGFDGVVPQVNVTVNLAGKSAEVKTPEPTKCACGGDKSSETPVAEAKPPEAKAPFIQMQPLDGSWESVCMALDAGSKAFLVAAGKAPTDPYAYYNCFLVATYPDYGVLAVEKGYQNYTFYRGEWKQGEKAPEWTGSPTEAALSVSLTDRANQILEVKELKAGKVLSSKNHKMLKKAHAAVKSITKVPAGYGPDNVPKSVAKKAMKAKECVKSVLDQVPAPPAQQKPGPDAKPDGKPALDSDDKSAETLATKLLGKLLVGDEQLGRGLSKSLRDELKRHSKLAERKQLADALGL